MNSEFRPWKLQIWTSLISKTFEDYFCLRGENRPENAKRESAIRNVKDCSSKPLILNRRACRAEIIKGFVQMELILPIQILKNKHV